MLKLHVSKYDCYSLHFKINLKSMSGITTKLLVCQEWLLI